MQAGRLPQLRMVGRALDVPRDFTWKRSGPPPFSRENGAGGYIPAVRAAVLARCPAPSSARIVGWDVFDDAGVLEVAPAGREAQFQGETIPLGADVILRSSASRRPVPADLVRIVTNRLGVNFGLHQGRERERVSARMG
jgi:hypothetical protein